MNNKLLEIVALALALGLAPVLPALAASSASTDVSISVDQYYNVTAGGTANLAISDSNYNTIGEYNFINAGATLEISVNGPWAIRAKLNQNMPSSPGGGYTLRVDDDRAQGSISGWSPTLSVSDVDLLFDGQGTAVNLVYDLDWRIEGLTEADGSKPLSRTVTFTIYGDGIV